MDFTIYHIDDLAQVFGPVDKVQFVHWNDQQFGFILLNPVVVFFIQFFY